MSTGTASSVFHIPPRCGIPSILFSSTFRLCCLRCILVAGTIVLAFQISGKAVGSVITGVTLLHHLLSALGPRFVPLFTWLDLLLMLAELVYTTWFVAVCLIYVNDYRWLPKRTITLTFNVWLLMIMLAALFCIKVIQLVDSRGRTLTQRVDILCDRVSDGPGYNRLRRFCNGTTIPWWRYPVHVLFGRKIWEQKLPGESLWIRLPRGFLALIVVSSLAIYALFQIVLDPINEMGLTPNRVLHSKYLPLTFTSTTPVVWNLIVTWHKRPNAPRTLRESISLEPVWGFLPEPTEGPFGPECDVIQATQDMLHYANLNSLEVIIFHCPPRRPIPADQAYSFRRRGADTRPNVRLRANFTELMSPGQLPSTRADMVFDAMNVYLALTNNTEDALLTTRPTPLFPGKDLVGVADLMVRQRLKAGELSTLGLVNLYDTFMIADISYVTSEPSTDRNVSTLRIGYQDDPREWTVIQDYREKSTFAGMAAVGGLGTFLSIVFVICFGNSLLGIMYRTKPMTPFGFFHNVENEKARVSASIIEKYSALPADLQSLKDNPGLLAFILDTLIDVDVVRVAEDRPHRVSSQHRRNGKLRDVEQELNAEKEGSDSDSGQEGSQRLIRENSNVDIAQNTSSDRDDDSREGLCESTSEERGEPLVDDDERSPLVTTSSSLRRPSMKKRSTF